MNRRGADKARPGRLRIRTVPVLAWSLACILTAGLGWLGWTVEGLTRPDPARLDRPPCRRVVDRAGNLLRFQPDERGERHLAAVSQDLSPLVRQAFLAAEDQRFGSHPGVDFRSVARAARDNLLTGRIVSGGSTITMQLVRLTDPKRFGGRSLKAKLLQAVAALRLERAVDKDRIMTAYLNRVPMGHNLVGVEAAARAYFGRPASELDLSQAAVLAALPQSPGRMGPWGPGREKLLTRSRWVVERMAELGMIDRRLAAGVRPPFFLTRKFPFSAPQAVEMALAGAADLPPGLIRTTLDPGLQRRAEAVLAAHRPRLARGGASQAAAVILDSRSGDILALAGSLEFTDRDQGRVNGALARRSAGSVLKPFLYALALDRGLSPTRPLADVNRVYAAPGGEWRPLNFDRRTRGPVAMRDALSASLNLPAVQLLSRLGVEPFQELLAELGLTAPPRAGGRPLGLGLAVGNAEIRLLDLAGAMAALVNRGRPVSPRIMARAGQDHPVRPPVISPQAAFIVADMLADPAARRAVLGPLSDRFGRAAVKTGTSTNFRDAWCVAALGRVVIAVWVGNFDGRPMEGLSGSSAAAPLAADLMEMTEPPGGHGPALPPPGVVRAGVCAVSGARPGPGCGAIRSEWFIAGAEPDRECAFHRPGTLTAALPPAYADWLAQRRIRHAAGRWRLQTSEIVDKTTAKPSGHTVLAGGRVRLGLRPDHSPRPRSADDKAVVSIAYPLDGDRFVTHGPAGQPIRLLARCAQPVDRVRWVIDGTELASVGPPFEAYYRPEPGRHTIAALGPDGRGAAVTITVQ